MALTRITGKQVLVTQSGTGAINRTAQDKLRESVSVKDFGAVGDGVADDTAAIQAAVSTLGASGTAVYFPHGVYIVGSTITLPTGSNLYADVQSAVIKQKSGANLDALLQSGVAGSSQTTVRMFGLRIDGNRANQTSGAGHVIRFYRPLYTWIDQCEVINARGDNINLAPESGDFENYIRNCRTYNAGRNNIRIEGNGTDCHIRGGNHGYSGASCILLSTSSSSINDATIWGGGGGTYGIEHYGVSCQIRNNEIEGFPYDGIWVTSSARHTFIEGNKIYANSFTAGSSGLYGGCIVSSGAGPGTFVGNRVYAALSDTSNYNHAYSLKFAGAHGVWEVSGNSMIYSGASNAGIEASAGVVVGILSADKCDALWSKSFVQIGLSSNLSPTLGGWTTFPFNSEAADVWSEWNTSTYRFTPKESGYYQFSGLILVDPDAAGNDMGFRLASDAGSEIARLGYGLAVNGNMIGVTLRNVRVFLTENTSYQIQYYLTGTTTQVLAGSAFTSIQIVRVPQ